MARRSRRGLAQKPKKKRNRLVALESTKRRRMEETMRRPLIAHRKMGKFCRIKGS
jgi:hypothetical protein